jgi:hypothetical protein
MVDNKEPLVVPKPYAFDVDGLSLHSFEMGPYLFNCLLVLSDLYSDLLSSDLKPAKPIRHPGCLVS